MTNRLQSTQVHLKDLPLHVLGRQEPMVVDHLLNLGCKHLPTVHLPLQGQVPNLVLIKRSGNLYINRKEDVRALRARAVLHPVLVLLNIHTSWCAVQLGLGYCKRAIAWHQVWIHANVVSCLLCTSLVQHVVLDNVCTGFRSHHTWILARLLGSRFQNCVQFQV